MHRVKRLLPDGVALLSAVNFVVSYIARRPDTYIASLPPLRPFPLLQQSKRRKENPNQVTNQHLKSIIT